ncbi:MAG: hypothetical protein AAB371_00590 [Patescibacteria group bacterium]|mgnify:FL=1
MEVFRKYIIVFLILIFGALSFYYVSATIKNPNTFNVIISLSCLFLFVIFNSILSSVSNLYISAMTHILMAVFLFLFFYNFGLNLITALVISLVYLVLQVYGYLIIYYFEKERLKINWLGIFKTSWRCASWFLVFVVAIIFAIKFDANIFENSAIKNAIEKTNPIFSKLNLPNPSSKITDFSKLQIPQDQLQQFKGLNLDMSNLKNIENINLNDISKQLNINLKGQETISDIVVVYLKNFWNGLNDNMKLVAKIIIAVFVITTIQPVFWVLGIILSIIALPIIAILGKLKFYSKETEQATKEKIVV